SQPRERERRKPWTPPEPVGRTLRQRVEAKERELGLRCDDVVCDIAPGDDDDDDDDSGGNWGGSGSEDGRVKMIKIHAAYDASGRACEHMFHAGCFVTSARVAGEGEESDEAGTDAEEEMIPVSCPVCRAEGSLTRGEWEEGVRMAMAVV
ncbi:hypothetical protein BU17DRAFT_43946, partial [Hysterangium stoloniferum]